MKKLLLKLFYLILFIPVFGLENSLACSCSASPPVYEFYEKSSAVFTGKVLSLRDVEAKEVDEGENGETEEYVYKERIFQFEIAEVFKGVKGKTVDVNVGNIKSSCYSGFDIGESYLIYANEYEENLRHGFCSRSQKLNYARDQVYFIRELLKGKPESQIYGAVERNDTYPNTTKPRVTPLESIKIILEGKHKNFETVTDKNGFYKFNKIPDGEYLLKPEYPSVYRKYYSEDQNLKILEGKVYHNSDGSGFEYGYKAAFIGFSPSWGNEVEGKVFDAEGKPIKFVAVRLLPASSPYEKIKSSYLWDEDENGKYSCSGETPGKYYLVAEIFMPNGTNDRVRVFYSQADTPEKSIPINLKATDKLNFDFILPAKFVVREVRGKVTWSDGTPVRGVKLSLQKTESYVEKDEDAADEVTDRGFDWDFTDEQGNFILQAFENAEYWLHAEDEFETTVDGEEKEIEVKAKPIKIKIGKINEPLKIVLRKP